MRREFKGKFKEIVGVLVEKDGQREGGFEGSASL
jgi:hypothetical protein